MLKNAYRVSLAEAEPKVEVTVQLGKLIDSIVWESQREKDVVWEKLQTYVSLFQPEFFPQKTWLEIGVVAFMTIKLLDEIQDQIIGTANSYMELINPPGIPFTYKLSGRNHGTMFVETIPANIIT